MRFLRAGAVLASAVLLAGCGSGGGDASPDPTASSEVAPHAHRGASAAGGLVAGPALPVTGHDQVAADLKSRLVRLNPVQAARLPEASVMGGFLDLRHYLEQFDVGLRPSQETHLRSEGFQGSRFESYLSRGDNGERYLVQLTRFTADLGSLTHLTNVDEATRQAGDLRPAHSSVPGAVAYETAPGAKLREVVEYVQRGPYVATVITRSDEYVPLDVLRADNVALMRAQVERLPV